MIVLDTNVISEVIRREPSSVVLQRLRRFASNDIHTTAITEAEIRLGLEILPKGTKRRDLQAQVDQMLKEDFVGRILVFDSAAAQVYATLVAARRASGRPISLADAQIAAIVQTHDAVLVTRNARDFQNCGFDVINPWDDAS